MAMKESAAAAPDVLDLSAAPVALDRDVFLRSLLRHLSGALQDVVGLEEAEGFISLVGQEMGASIGAQYRRALAVERLDPRQLAGVLVDLKRRIQGDFYVIAQDADKIVFGNRRCPFGDKVKQRPALCMMTSNVFGSISAQDLGYARVDLEQTIARGHADCRIVVYLNPAGPDDATQGREYFRGLDAPGA